tara:strand:+ start:179 stop:568 length:390 start_codon:yes stop_codon:yes gene_type:complete
MSNLITFEKYRTLPVEDPDIDSRASEFRVILTEDDACELLLSIESVLDHARSTSDAFGTGVQDLLIADMNKIHHLQALLHDIYLDGGAVVNSTAAMGDTTRQMIKDRVATDRVQVALENVREGKRLRRI